MSLDTRILQNFIGNAYVDSSSQETFELIDPVTEKVIGRSPASNQEDVDRAYAAASDAAKVWGRFTPSQRQAAILKIADELEAHRDDLVDAQSRNTGQPKYLVASEEVDVSADQLRFFAERLGSRRAPPPGSTWRASHRPSVESRWGLSGRSRRGTTRS